MPIRDAAAKALAAKIYDGVPFPAGGPSDELVNLCASIIQVCVMKDEMEARHDARITETERALNVAKEGQA
jgi:hypothetical protein